MDSNYNSQYIQPPLFNMMQSSPMMDVQTSVNFYSSTDSEDQYFKYEMEQLESRNLQLINENIMWKNQVDDLRRAKETHLDKITRLEHTVEIERQNYNEILKNMLETAKENTELVNKVDELNVKKISIHVLEEEKKKLEDQRNELKSKLNKIGIDFSELQIMFDSQENCINKMKMKNKQIKSAYTKYKSESQNLKAEVKRLTFVIRSSQDLPSLDVQGEMKYPKGDIIQFPESTEKTTIMNCIKQLAEEEIDFCMKNAWTQLKFSFLKRKNLEKENQTLKETIARREKEFTITFQKARARILNLNETLRMKETEAGWYKEQMLSLDRSSKEQLIKKEKETETWIAKKLAEMEQENTRLQDERDRAIHRVEILTQRISTLHQLRVNQDIINDIGDDSCVPPPLKKKVTFCVDVGAGQSILTNPGSIFGNQNSVNYNVLRSVTMTSASDTSKRKIETEEKKLEPKPSLLTLDPLSVAVNLETKTIARKKNPNQSKYSRHLFKCDLCPAKCASECNLKKHKEKTHLRRKKWLPEKDSSSHRTDHNTPAIQKNMSKLFHVCIICQKVFHTKGQQMHHIC